VWLTVCIGFAALGLSSVTAGSDPATEALPSPLARTADACVRPLLSVRDTIPALETAAFNPVMLAAAAQSTAAVARTAAGDVAEPTAGVLHKLADRAETLAADPSGQAAADTVRLIASDADLAAAACTDPSGPTRAVTGFGVGGSAPNGSGDGATDLQNDSSGPGDTSPATDPSSEGAS
jgi:hypothetical protein